MLKPKAPNYWNHYVRSGPFAQQLTPINGPCITWDLRAETGGNTPDESVLHPEGHPFRYALFDPTPGEHPTAEMRILVPMDQGFKEVSVVWEPTGRPGVTEITPQQLWGASHNEEYRGQLMAWLGGQG